MEDSQDDFEPVVDSESNFNQREMTSELWVSREDKGT